METSMIAHQIQNMIWIFPKIQWVLPNARPYDLTKFYENLRVSFVSNHASKQTHFWWSNKSVRLGKPTSQIYCNRWLLFENMIT